MKSIHTESHEDEITLTDIWITLQKLLAHLWRRKAWILGVAFLFSLGGYLTVKRAQPIYSATLTFSLEQGSSKSAISGLASQFGFSMGGDGGGMFSGDNLLTLMKSRRLVEDVLLTSIPINGKEILLVNQYIESSPELLVAWKSAGLYPFQLRDFRTASEDSALGIVYSWITQKVEVSKQDKQLSFVSLSYSGHNEAFARGFVEQLAKQATDFYVVSKTANNRANIEKLQRRVDSVTAELEIAMINAGRAYDANIFTVQSAAKVPSLERQMKVTMLTTLYGELVKNLELSKTIAFREEPLITIIDRPHYPLRVRKSGLKGALTGGLLGGFLTVLFFAGSEFLRILNRHLQQFK